MNGSPTLGIPLRGRLTALEREWPSTWKCGVCVCENDNDSLAPCRECGQPRSADWMEAPDGTLIQPGVTLVLPADLPLTPVSPDPMATPSEIRSATALAAVVTDVSRVPREVHLCAYPDTGPQTPGMAPLAPPTAFIMAGDHVPRVQPIAHTDTRAMHLMNFGLCDRCRSVYRIVDGEAHLSEAQDRSQRRARALESDLDRVQESRGEAKQRKNYSEVEALTGKAKALQKDLHLEHRRLAPPQTWCPFCGWAPAF